MLSNNPTPPDYLTVAAVALVDAQGRVLVQQRLPGKQMAGLWEFPGGKVEPGETPEAALLRELVEELGIEIDPSAIVPASFASEPLGTRHLLLLLYICREWQGEPRPLDSAALRWLRPGELHTLPMPPADKPLIAAIEALVSSSA